jgi:hypothetical protein
MSKMTKNLILYVYSHDFFPIFEIWEVVVLKVVEANYICVLHSNNNNVHLFKLLLDTLI